MTGVDGAPLVTVALLLYGASPWTRDVIAAVQANTAVPYELLVVDNGTTDDVRAHLATLERVRVVTPGRNLGFGVGQNLAANLACGRYFCTLNSDALVPPGWLDALVAPLERDPAVAATMPVFVYPDGRCQEAGATVEPSGQVIAFGRFDDPDSPQYRLSGRVPFASAACLVTRTDRFRAIGGFDARYGVAYYEDVDLVFSFIARGEHVEVVADVRVVHAQGASSESSADAERLLLGNRERFRATWAPYLAGRPYVYARPEAHHVAAARDFDVCDRVLLLVEHLGAPGDGTPGARLARELRAWLADGRVTVAPAVPVDDDALDAWLTAGVEVVARDDIDALLHARCFHFAAIVHDTPLDGALEATVRERQPQAHVGAIPGGDIVREPQRFAGWLRSLELVPRRTPLGTPG